VPLIVVSPFARQGYVSHVTHDFGSILHFIEEVYRLPSLGYADTLADDLSDCFDFHRHNTFKKIPAPHDAKYFLNDKSTPEDPDNDGRLPIRVDQSVADLAAKRAKAYQPC
jgi:phospholipase C